MNSTSTLSRKRSFAQSHDVPPSRRYSSVANSAGDAVVVVDRVQRLGVVVLRLAFVQALKVRVALLLGALADRAQHVADRLVADGRDADFLPGLHELENHVRARERLAGAGRALDRQHAVVELEREANRFADLGVDAADARRHGGGPLPLARAARRGERE